MTYLDELVVLFTGSRDWVRLVEDGAQRIRNALDTTVANWPNWDPWTKVILRHGNAVGADQVAREFAAQHGWTPDPHNARDFATPLLRNQYMVDLAPRPNVCVAFALDWASGTGHCARRARVAGIPVLDFGAPTGPRPY